MTKADPRVAIVAEIMTRTRIERGRRMIDVRDMRRKEGRVPMKEEAKAIIDALDKYDASDKEPACVTAIWLKNIGDHVVVEVEIAGKWVEVIRERADGAYSHIIESGGITQAIPRPSRPPHKCNCRDADADHNCTCEPVAARTPTS